MAKDYIETSNSPEQLKLASKINLIEEPTSILDETMVESNASGGEKSATVLDDKSDLNSAHQLTPAADGDVPVDDLVDTKRAQPASRRTTAPDDVESEFEVNFMHSALFGFLACLIIMTLCAVLRLPVFASMLTTAAVQAYVLYKFLHWTKVKLSLEKLSPLKSFLATFLPVLMASFFGTMLSLITICVASIWQIQNFWILGKKIQQVESATNGPIQFAKLKLSAGMFAVSIAMLIPCSALLLVVFWSILTVKAVKNSGRQKDVNRRFSETTVHDNKVCLQYRSSAGLDRWLRERFSHNSRKKDIFFASMIAVSIVLGSRFLIDLFKLLLLTPKFAGPVRIGTHPGLAGHQSTSSLLAVLTLSIVSALLGFVIIRIARSPNSLQLTEAGLKFVWRYPFFNRDGALVQWSAIDQIFIERPFGKTLPQDASLVFRGAGSDLFKAKLSHLQSQTDRSSLLEAIDKWSTQGTTRTADVTELLTPPADHSYTELWLQALTAPPKRERLKPLITGTTLQEDRYLVTRQLGSGGQGFAYLCEDRKESLDVVLKEYLLPIFVEMESRRRAIVNFEMEARTLQSLDSDKIVKLRDFFIEDHRAYLVLEHIDGESIKQIVERRGALPENEATRLALQMCDILRYLHGLTPPVVHRDFTPDNLILRKDGELKLIDFNVAQKVEQDSATFTGTVVGKQAYLPPEQFRGNASTASDIYALGCCLFYMLTGSEPEPITSSHPITLVPDISLAMDILVAKSTALELDERFSSVAQVDAGLNSLKECTQANVEN